MKKQVIYKHQIFYSFLVILMFALIIWNILNVISGSPASLLSILIQAIMLVLLLTKHEKTKIVFKIWSIIVMIGSGLRLLSSILYFVSGEDLNPMIEGIVQAVVMGAIAYIVYAYNERDVYIGVPKGDDNVL